MKKSVEAVGVVVGVVLGLCLGFYGPISAWANPDGTPTSSSPAPEPSSMPSFSPPAPRPSSVPAPAPVPSAVPSPRPLPGGEFSGAAPEAQFTRYSDDSIQLLVKNKVKVACEGDRCTLFSLTNRSNAFTVEFGVGYGNKTNSNANVVVVGGSPFQPDPQPYVEMTVRYVWGKCVQTVDVPEAMYVAMTTYMYHLMNEDGGTRPNFSPAEQTMLMLYTTILSQAKGCSPTTQ